MKRSVRIVIIAALILTLVPVGVFAASQSASHDKCTYTSTNLTKVTYRNGTSYVTTRASFKSKDFHRNFVTKDVLSQSINAGYMRTKAYGSVQMTPYKIRVYGVPAKGRKYLDISVSNTNTLKKYLSNANIKKIRKSAYNRKLVYKKNIHEAASGKVYAKFYIQEMRKNFCKTKINKTVSVIYVASSGYFDVQWRANGKKPNYNLYTNYGYNTIKAEPKVTTKGVSVDFSRGVKKGYNAVLVVQK